MHLWPSMQIRDSFKKDYLKKLEWNLHRMKSEKKESLSNQQKLLDNNNSSEGGSVLDIGKEEVIGNCSRLSNIVEVFGETLMLLSCCYCCFCCGACVGQEEN